MGNDYACFLHHKGATIACVKVSDTLGSDPPLWGLTGWSLGQFSTFGIFETDCMSHSSSFIGSWIRQFYWSHPSMPVDNKELYLELLHQFVSGWLMDRSVAQTAIYVNSTVISSTHTDQVTEMTFSSWLPGQSLYSTFIYQPSLSNMIFLLEICKYFKSCIYILTHSSHLSLINPQWVLECFCHSSCLRKWWHANPSWVCHTYSFGVTCGWTIGGIK